jgi:hypothetical protein
LYAQEDHVVDESTVEKWGYFTKNIQGSYDYKTTNKPAAAISTKYQVIRSKQPIKGYKYSYYYFTLSEECYSGKSEALSRKLSVGNDLEKDYRSGFIVGKCIYIVGCNAKYGTYKEKPKILRLFKEYVINKPANK